MSIAIVFPGQGAQRVGMAADFVSSFAESKSIFAKASNALELNMEMLCFEQNDLLDQTEFTQPAILTAEIAMLEAIKSKYGLIATYFAGHSLGEYTALVAAEVLTLEDAVKIVRKRGALMQRAVPVGVGAMAALICDDLEKTTYREVVKASGAEIANVNSSAQVVISGSKQAVELTCANLKDKLPQVRSIFLNVSAPFHCSLMRVIEEEFRATLMQAKPRMKVEQSASVFSNFSGKLHSAPTLIDNLVNQISGSVLWNDNMQNIAKLSSAVFEIGPGRVLGKFFSTLNVSVKTITDLRSLEKCMEFVK